MILITSFYIKKWMDKSKIPDSFNIESGIFVIVNDVIY
jgi:hypothetical protein